MAHELENETHDNELVDNATAFAAKLMVGYGLAELSFDPPLEGIRGDAGQVIQQVYGWADKLLSYTELCTAVYGAAQYLGILRDVPTQLAGNMGEADA